MVGWLLCFGKINSLVFRFQNRHKAYMSARPNGVNIHYVCNTIHPNFFHPISLRAVRFPMNARGSNSSSRLVQIIKSFPLGIIPGPYSESTEQALNQLLVVLLTTCQFRSQNKSSRTLVIPTRYCKMATGILDPVQLNSYHQGQKRNIIDIVHTAFICISDC